MFPVGISVPSSHHHSRRALLNLLWMQCSVRPNKEI